MFDNQAWRSPMSRSGRDMQSTSSRYLMIILLICLFVIPLIAVSLSATTANADSTANKYIFMPVTLNGYFEGSQQEGISGRVFSYGKPAANIPLGLHRYVKNEFDVIEILTRTNDEGYYLFQDIPSLEEGVKYYVGFGQNLSDPKYVYFWNGPSIETYNKGDILFGGNFDIADVPLVSPVTGAVETLPINFRWEKRGLPGDSYRLMIFDFDKGDYWRSKNLGDVDNITVESLPEGIEFGKKYEWYIEVYMGPDNYGESFMINEITFKQSNTQQRSTFEDVFTRGSGRGGRQIHKTLEDFDN